MSLDLEDKIIAYLKEHEEVTCVSAVEIAHHFSKTYKTSKEALESLKFQKKLNSHDISSKASLGEGNYRQIRKFQDPFFVYYLPNGIYQRRKKL